MKFESIMLPVIGCLLLNLQGCGSSSGTKEDPSPTKTPGAPAQVSTSPGAPASTTYSLPSSTPLTTPAPKNPRAPSSGHEVADLMNREYHGFESDDPTSSYGVFLRSTESTKVYCHNTCFHGMADCRVSGSVFNKEVMVTMDGTLSWGYGDSTGLGTGYFVNRTEVQNYLGKCAYAHDGGTDYRYNMGCGCNMQGSGDCQNPSAAFWSLDPETGYTKPLTDKSPLLDKCSVENLDGGSGFWKGPAFYRATGFPKPDEMFKMLQYRADLADKTVWNEMVLDGEAVLERLSNDPASVVPAIIYVTSVSGAKTKAIRMAQEFSEQWNLPSPIPVIKLNTSIVVTDGVGKPFSFETQFEEVRV